MQEVPLVASGKDAYIRFEGNASYPTKIVMHGKLVSTSLGH
jgi:hypothetical protein